jgi:hypothetical protein
MYRDLPARIYTKVGITDTFCNGARNAVILVS